jgi:hypothetical protein
MFFRFPPDIRWKPEHPSERLISALDTNTFTPARGCAPYRDSRERATGNRKLEGARYQLNRAKSPQPQARLRTQ